MTKTLTIRLPAKLVQQLKIKAKSAKTNPTAVLRRMAVEYVREGKPSANSMQEDIRIYAGTWDGHYSEEELLLKTRG